MSFLSGLKAKDMAIRFHLCSGN